MIQNFLPAITLAIPKIVYGFCTRQHNFTKFNLFVKKKLLFTLIACKIFPLSRSLLLVGSKNEYENSH